MSVNFRYKEQLAGKRQFNLYSMTADCPLTSNENLVLGYLIYSTKFGTPSGLSVALWTGLSRNTVSEAISTVCSVHGVMGAERQMPPVIWHYQITGKERHEFYRRTAHHTYYTPAAGGSLSANDAVVWGWVYNQHAVGRREYATRYIATCLGLDHRTVAASISKLTELELMKLDDARLLMPDQLGDWQLDLFSDKGSKGSTELGTFTPAARPSPVPSVKSVSEVPPSVKSVSEVPPSVKTEPPTALTTDEFFGELAAVSHEPTTNTENRTMHHVDRHIKYCDREYAQKYGDLWERQKAHIRKHCGDRLVSNDDWLVIKEKVTEHLDANLAA